MSTQPDNNEPQQPTPNMNNNPDSNVWETHNNGHYNTQNNNRQQYAQNPGYNQHPHSNPHPYNTANNWNHNEKKNSGWLTLLLAIIGFILALGMFFAGFMSGLVVGSASNKDHPRNIGPEYSRSDNDRTDDEKDPWKQWENSKKERAPREQRNRTTQPTPGSTSEPNSGKPSDDKQLTEKEVLNNWKG